MTGLISVIQAKKIFGNENEKLVGQFKNEFLDISGKTDVFVSEVKHIYLKLEVKIKII